MTILIVLLLLIAIPFIIAVFIKKKYAIEREITINKPKLEVFNYIKHLKNQEKYSKWVMTDPAMKKEFKGTDGTVGCVYAWDGNKKAGKGEQELIGITNGERIDIEIRFIKPFVGIAYTPFTTESVAGGQTKVKWGMQGQNKYPINLMNLFVDNLLGKDLEISLGNLKRILEK